MEKRKRIAYYADHSDSTVSLWSSSLKKLSNGMGPINNSKLDSGGRGGLGAKTILQLNDIWASGASPTLGCSIKISRDIYMYVCLSLSMGKKLYAKMRGRNYVVQTHACSKISFGILKRSVDYNFRLEFLILPSSGRLKPTCDTRIIHLNYYTLEQL